MGYETFFNDQDCKSKIQVSNIAFFAKINILPKISHFFVFPSLAKNANIDFFSQNFAKKEFENVELSVSEQEFHKFFFALICRSYKTYGFRGNFFLKIFSLHSFSRKNAKLREKTLRNASENFRSFSGNVSFAGNPKRAL